MPRFFNLRRRKQPVVMSYIDEVKDEEVLRVVKHIRNRPGLPALPPSGGPNSSGTMKTEESDERSVGWKAQGPAAPPPAAELLALIAEVGSEVQEPLQVGPCSMKAVQTIDPKMLASTPILNIKKASSTRSWVKRANFNLAAPPQLQQQQQQKQQQKQLQQLELQLQQQQQQHQPQQQEPHQQQQFMNSKWHQKAERAAMLAAEKKSKQQPQPSKPVVPTIDTSHDGNLDGMDSPTRYLPVTPKTPVAITSYFCTPTLSCTDVQMWSSNLSSVHHNDEGTISTARTDESAVSWSSRIREAEQRIGIAFIGNVLDRMVGDDDTTIGGGTTVMGESTIGPSLIFSPESIKYRAARQCHTPGGTSTVASDLLTPATESSYDNDNKNNSNNNRNSHKMIMGKLAKWDEMDRLLVEDESSTIFGGEDATHGTLAIGFSQTSESGDTSSDFFTTDDDEDEQTEMTGGTDYDATSAYTSSVFTSQ